MTHPGTKVTLGFGFHRVKKHLKICDSIPFLLKHEGFYDRETSVSNPRAPFFYFSLLFGSRETTMQKRGRCQWSEELVGALPSKADVPAFLFSSASMTSSTWKQMV